MTPWILQHRRKIVALLLVLIPSVLVFSSAGASVGAESSRATQISGQWLGGLQSLTTTIVATTLGFIPNGLKRGRGSEEQREMQIELDRLREENARLIGVLQENARLRELLGFQDQFEEFETLPARVIGRDLSPYFRVMKVQIRAEGVVEPRMPVVSSQGVVGQIHRVYDGYADVVLVADPRSKVDAIVQRNRAMGIVEGMGHESNYKMNISYLSSRDEVRVGDRIVTSGMGGIFPRELVVGYVEEIQTGERRLFQEVVLAPAVDFSRVEEVFVITNARQ